MERKIRAAELFAQGYNCAQAVAMAFSDLVNLPEEICAKMAASFGGGIGRLGEVCGAVSGMLMITGMLYSCTDAQDADAKKAHYALVRELAERFREQSGSLLCRDLMKDGKVWPMSEELTQMSLNRPCVRFVVLAVEILEQYIQDHPV